VVAVGAARRQPVDVELGLDRREIGRAGRELLAQELLEAQHLALVARRVLVREVVRDDLGAARGRGEQAIEQVGAVRAARRSEAERATHATRPAWRQIFILLLRSE